MVKISNQKSYFFTSDGVWEEGSTAGTTSLSSAKVGDSVIFGSYEQDNIVCTGYEAV